MSATDLELLGQFARAQSQEAFTELVQRHLNLVYSAALRQVRSPQLAEEVAQSVFTKLAREAARLKPDTVVTAWLYQVTRHTAIDVVRREARRQAREQIALQMSHPDDPAADWTQVEPLLDEAMLSLEETDRTAILLRYFENKSLREVGEALGASEDAAQKRVSRAVERLREFFARRRVTVGAAGLAGLVSVNAIQAAPPGLAAAIVSGAAATASATASVSTAIAVSKTIAMTTLQKTIVTVVIAGAVTAAVYQARQTSRLRQEVAALQAQQAQHNALSNQIQELTEERDRATNQLAALAREAAATQKHPAEVLRLRGEVGRLRQENASMASGSPLSKVTANPEARKLLRDQQKLGMSAIYKDFSRQANLSSEQTAKLNELLADHIMENVDNVTRVLHDKPDAAQMDAIFTAQDAAIQEQVRALLGDDGAAQYQEYTRKLLSSISAEQFKGMLTGTTEEKQAKSKQLAEAMHAEAQAALADAGLSADYQVLPILNFRNIASEQEAEKSLKLLQRIYEGAAARGGSFLSPEDLKKFDAFKTTALNNSRTALTLNRTLMAPLAQ